MGKGRDAVIVEVNLAPGRRYFQLASHRFCASDLLAKAIVHGASSAAQFYS